MKKSGMTAVLLGLTAVLLSSSVSRAVLLSDLLGNAGSLTNGDMRFSNFVWQGVPGSSLPADQIDIQPTTDVHGNLGIRFQGGFRDLPGGSVHDTVVGFDVEVAAVPWIEDIHLLSNGTLNGGRGFFQITETVTHPDWPQPLQLYSYDSNLPSGSHVIRLADTVDLRPARMPVNKLRVVKDIQLEALDLNLPVNLSFVDQTFSRTPEPNAAGMLLTGIAGLMASRCKK